MFTFAHNWVTCPNKRGTALADVLILRCNPERSNCSATFGSYFRHFENLDKTYGPLGAAIGLYVWFYLSGFVILLGGEINFLLGELRDHRTLQSSTPVRTQSNLNAAA
jgi:Virulence factor BrkB